MKIKWKILLSIDAILLLLIILTNLYVRDKVTALVSDKTYTELENYSELGMSVLDVNYPGDWRIEGSKLYKGNALINDDYQVVDELTGTTGILATIFAGDTRISTTVKDENGDRKVGTTASQEVQDTVLKKSLPYTGSAVVAGRKAASYYVPLQDKDGNTVGMWFVGVYTDVLNKEISVIVGNIALVLFILLIISSVAIYFLGDYISKGYRVISKDLERMANGDFTLEFEDKYVNRKDEIGSISRSFVEMQTKINDVIHSIKNEITNVSTSSSVLAEGAKNVYRDIENISATTEELSAGMEESAASTEEMNATSVAIEDEISNVAGKASNGETIALEIKARAEGLKQVALDSEKTAIDIYNNTNKKLRQSLDKASAISEISALSKTILDITAQTNLLALNASIESARAGEAGKGFAVVANEIANLAHNSKAAVNQIEMITNDISLAVEDIVTDSKQLLDFVDTKVIKDYGVLVQTGEQYYTDANTIENMVAEIKNSSIQLNESISYIRRAIDEITIASQEGSKGSSEIAEKSTSIFHKTNEVLDQANRNNEIANALNDFIKFFKTKEADV